MASRFPEAEEYDVVGAGFGPAGIALAAAMADDEEANPQRRWKSLFLEQAPDSRWQPEMLLPGCDIQHHFFRDFATPRDPRSRFTFAAYLHEKGRLFSFGLLGGSPGRTEWADYVEWTARQLRHRVRYGRTVTSVEPVPAADGGVDRVRVTSTGTVDGSTASVLAANLVLSTGRQPNIPPLFAGLAPPRVFHSHHFLSTVQRLDPAAAPTVAVIGSGQNAIEILLHLAGAFPASTLWSIGRNSGFRLYDLGNFSNECYCPEEVEYFFSLEKPSRRRLYEDVKHTNYSSVDPDVSRALYWKVYEDRVRGTERIHVVKRTEVADVVEREDGALDLVLRDLYRGTRSRVRVDVVILCTGFVEEREPALLRPLLPHLRRDADGDLEVSRGYRVGTRDGCRVGIYLNGLTEQTHGISDAASFSMMALKAGRILDGLAADQSAVRPRRPAAELVGVEA
jgi:L-ornithine N5-monooxygenase